MSGDLNRRCPMCIPKRESAKRGKRLGFEWRVSHTQLVCVLCLNLTKVLRKFYVTTCASGQGAWSTSLCTSVWSCLVAGPNQTMMDMHRTDWVIAVWKRISNCRRELSFLVQEIHPLLRLLDDWGCWKSTLGPGRYWIFPETRRFQ